MDDPSQDQAAEAIPELDQPSGFSRDVALILLSWAAEFYLEILESVFSADGYCVVQDVVLNRDYLWIVNLIQRLLQNDILNDFPAQFSPALPDVLVETTQEVDFFMIRPSAESFLTAVQSYEVAQGDFGARRPSEGSPGFIMLETLREKFVDIKEHVDMHRRNLRVAQKSLSEGKVMPGPSGMATVDVKIDGEVPIDSPPSPPTESQQGSEDAVPKAEGTPDGQTALQALKQPSQEAIAAYLKHKFGKKTQGEIADDLGVTQGTVSRRVGQVEAFITAGNVLPDILIPRKEAGSTPSTTTVDPDTLDMGARLDHRTPRQRETKSEDSDD